MIVSRFDFQFDQYQIICLSYYLDIFECNTPEIDEFNSNGHYIVR